MKLFKKLIFIFLSIGALISCDGMDATYKEFIEEGILKPINAITITSITAMLCRLGEVSRIL